MYHTNLLNQNVQKMASMECHLLELKRLTERLQTVDASQEALLKDIFVNIANLFGKVFNTFKTIVTKFGVSLKRSEIRYFSESNHKTVELVESLIFKDLANMVTPVPNGMVSKYLPTTLNIKNGYSAIKVIETSKYIRDFLDSISKIIISFNNGDLVADKLTTDSAFQIINATMKDLSPIVVQNTKDFSGITNDKKPSPLEIPFLEAYESMNDFRSVRTELIKMETNLQAIKPVSDTMSDCSEAIDILISNISKASEAFPKSFIGELSEFVRLSATIFDTYGIFATNQLALEHNHIEVIRKAYATTK